MRKFKTGDLVKIINKQVICFTKGRCNKECIVRGHPERTYEITEGPIESMSYLKYDNKISICWLPDYCLEAVRYKWIKMK